VEESASVTTQMTWVLSSRNTGEKNHLLFIDEKKRKAFGKTLKSRSEVAAAPLELIKKKQSRTQASLVYLRNDGTKDYETKYCKTFYAKRKSVMRLPKDTVLNRMDWPRDSTSPSWTRFAVCLSMRTCLPSSGLRCTLCSAHLKQPP